MGIVLDQKTNMYGNHERIISDKSVPVKVMIMPTNEELCLANNIYSFINTRSNI